MPSTSHLFTLIVVATLGVACAPKGPSFTVEVPTAAPIEVVPLADPVIQLMTMSDDYLEQGQRNTKQSQLD